MASSSTLVSAAVSRFLAMLRFNRLPHRQVLTKRARFKSVDASALEVEALTLNSFVNFVLVLRFVLFGNSRLLLLRQM
jgi:hypothetical protein